MEHVPGWDDEAEQLTLQVIDRLGERAVAGALDQACNEIERDGAVLAAGDAEAIATPDGRVFAGRELIQAYKTRLRALLTIH